MYKENKKLILITFVSLIFCIISAFLGLTYSYFSAFIIGENEDVVTKVLSVGIEVMFTDTEYMHTEHFKPGDTITKTFTVENTSVKPAQYDVIWDDLTNTFTNGELTYSVICVSYFKYGTENERIEGVCNSKTETVVPNVSDILVTDSQSLDPNMTHVYTLTVNFKETNSNQNYNQRAVLLGKIEVTSGIEDFGVTSLFVNSRKVNELDEDSLYALTGYECSNGETITYYGDTKSILVTPIGATTTCSLYFMIVDEMQFEFSYIADDTMTRPYIQRFIAQANGIYKLEVWGASGGDYNNSSLVGGRGGYSIGYIELNYKDILYIVVGGTNGLNGGGSTGDSHGRFGGGATHIATMSLDNGFLYNLSSNRDSVLIVGGGGGGSTFRQAGGAGGGINGLDKSGKGGTQISGGAGGQSSDNTDGSPGSFGKGGNSSKYAGGGGGGWYGGGSGAMGYTSSEADNPSYAGGGGSGYVKSTLTDAYTYAGNFSFLSPSGISETGHSGHGYARITYVGNAE